MPSCSPGDGSSRGSAPPRSHTAPVPCTLPAPPVPDAPPPPRSHHPSLVPPVCPPGFPHSHRRCGTRSPSAGSPGSPAGPGRRPRPGRRRCTGSCSCHSAVPVGRDAQPPHGPGPLRPPPPLSPPAYLSSAPRQHSAEVGPGVHCHLEVPGVAAVDVQHGPIHLQTPRSPAVAKVGCPRAGGRAQGGRGWLGRARGARERPSRCVSRGCR